MKLSCKKCGKRYSIDLTSDESWYYNGILQRNMSLDNLCENNKLCDEHYEESK